MKISMTLLLILLLVVVLVAWVMPSRSSVDITSDADAPRITIAVSRLPVLRSVSL